jgi:hypothetical protein
MSMKVRLIRLLSIALLGAACGDDQHFVDAAATSPGDASGDADGRSTDALSAPTIALFDNPDGAFVWECGWKYDLDYVVGTYLDLTRPVEMQTGDPAPTSVRCFKHDREDLETWGGIWFRTFEDPAGPPPSVRLAAGPQMVLDGEYVDKTVTPPAVKDVGDVVGPDDDWDTGTSEYYDYGSVTVAHIQDASQETAPSQVWFMSGTIGVRFATADGVHYGFVELEFLPDSTVYGSDWKPVRWGYRTEPDEPLTIPP